MTTKMTRRERRKKVPFSIAIGWKSEIRSPALSKILTHENSKNNKIGQRKRGKTRAEKSEYGKK